jgi:hypothetical protein
MVIKVYKYPLLVIFQLIWNYLLINHFLFKLNFGFHYFKTRLHFKIDCIIFVKFKNVKKYYSI